MLEMVKNSSIVSFLTRWATVIIWCSYILPVTALLIYTETEANLHKCDVNFNGWMFAFITTTFTFITITLMERCNGYTRFVAKCGIVAFLILWITACILFDKSNETGVCKLVSSHTYNFIFYFIFTPIGLLILFTISIIATSF